MSGNTSKTYILDTEGMKTFIKKAPVDKFDPRTLTFQSNLRQVISGQFNINQFDNIKVVTGGTMDLTYEISFEHLEEKQWAPNKTNMELIGKSMAYLHNHCNRNKNQITLNTKTEDYSTMNSWLMLSDNIPFKKESYKRRLEIFNNIPRLNLSQPKIALHRDFKPHNIIFDGERYHLIDFDFAAIDYVSLEVMGFIVDIIKTGLSNAESFIRAYISNVDVSNIKPMSFVDDYLNYLCTNTFPYYMKDSLEYNNFKKLVEHRNESLEILWMMRDKINKIIEKVINENI
jgi:serine/threonine protein kinase